MLIISRLPNESVYINGDKIKVKILDVRGRQVRLGIEAPRNIEVHRQEIWEKILRERADEGTKAVLA
jgi:carbon storage regulator